jgi:hypothetical protein
MRGAPPNRRGDLRSAYDAGPPGKTDMRAIIESNRIVKIFLFIGI